MTVYSQYTEDVGQWSASLGGWHGVLYSHAVCLRVAPLYFNFSAHEGWGDNGYLMNVHRLAQKFLFEARPDLSSLDSAYSQLEEVIPDTEDFPDCSAACDAGVIHLYTLSLMRRHDPAEIRYIADYCYNIVDAVAGNELVPAGIMTSDMEEALQRHPLVQGEVEWQALGRQLLANVSEGDQEFARQFLVQWACKLVLK